MTPSQMEPPSMDVSKQRSPNNDPNRRISSQSLDGVFVRPEDYSPETSPSTGTAGMMRGFVEAGLNRVGFLLP